MHLFPRLDFLRLSFFRSSLRKETPGQTGRLALLLFALLAPLAALRANTIYATPYTFSTFAGLAGVSGSADAPGGAARFNEVFGVAADALGNVYVADYGSHTIRKISPLGVVTTFAGAAGSPGSTDATGSAARFNMPASVAVDAAGNVYVADFGNSTIRKITPAGVVTTLAGTALSNGSTDATGSAARFNGPQGVAVDTAGNVYVGDRNNHTIRKITAAGVVTTLAGSATNTGSTDGTGGAARFFYPFGLTVDSAGNVFVADSFNHTIRKITAAGVVTTFAGTAGSQSSTDGTGGAARFKEPRGVAVDGADNLYVADTNNQTIRKITPAGVVTTLAGTAGSFGPADGTGSTARFSLPNGIAVDATGRIYVADYFNNAVRKITPGGVVTTLAGVAGSSGTADGTANYAVRFNNPYGTAVDSAGNIYVADRNNHEIRKITPAGVVTTLAGLAGTSGATEGTGHDARFNLPNGIAVDAAGNVYVADTNNFTIRKITSAGVVSTLAGLAGNSGATNGTGSAARFGSPTGVAVDGAGNVYVADQFYHTIRKITPAGVVTTFAGSPGNSGTTDATGIAARFNFPYGVAVDGAGNVYVADTNNVTIRKITSAGVVTTLAGLANNSGTVDGTGSAARFAVPNGVAVDAAGNVYVTDTSSNTIRKITSAGVVTTLAGLANNFGSVDGTGSAARFSAPFGVAVDSAGSLYVADRNNHEIRKITSAGVVTTLAGLVGLTGSVDSADGPGIAARFKSPQGVATDGSGNIYVADTSNHTIRKITPAGLVTTLAGTAGSFGSTDGSGGAEAFYGPQGVAADGAGNIYVADTGNHTIRKITSAGVVSTLAGSAGSSGPADGTGSAARFSGPSGVAADGAGNVYVADQSNHTIRKITAGGVVTTLAGTAGATGSTDGTGSAARFYFPQNVAVDGAGNVYVADLGSYTIRKITPAGVVTTLAGAGVYGTTDGTGGAARFGGPTGVAVDASGNVFVADYLGAMVRRITAAGVVTTLGGTADVSGSTDGTGGAALFVSPFGVAVDAAGNIYVVDYGNHTIRKGVLLPSVPIIIAQSENQTVTAGHPVSFMVEAGGYPAPAFQWKKNGADIPGATSATLTFASARPSDAGVYKVAATNSAGTVTSNDAALTVRSFTNDFGGDGKTDVLWHNTSTGLVASWTSDGGYLIFGSEDVNWSVVDRGDFDGDGKADVLWRNASSGIVASWTTTAGYQVYGVEGGGWAGIDTGDFDGDGKTDVLWHNTSNGIVASWTTTAGYQVYGVEGGGWAVIDTGDFDGDGKADVLWHNTSSGIVASWTTTAGYQVYGVEDGGWAVIDTGDFDGDGKADVLWRNTSSGIVASWTTTAGYQVYGVEGGGWAVIDTGDFDGDGKADVLWRNTSSGIVASWTTTAGYQVYGVEGGGWQVIEF